MLENYTFTKSTCPTNARRGGIGIFYKNDPPLKVRNDLSFDEATVAEMTFGKNKFCFQLSTEILLTDKELQNLRHFY